MLAENSRTDHPTVAIRRRAPAELLVAAGILVLAF
jgi:hypothetical protein